MNVEEVKALGQFLKSRAADVSQLRLAIETRVDKSTWVGPDRDQFSREWWPSHSKKLEAIESELHGLGQSALNNVEEQKGASANLSGSPSWQNGSYECVDYEQAGRNSLAGLLSRTWGDDADVIAKGQILIRRLPDGSVVVVLPGIESLLPGRESAQDITNAARTALYPGMYSDHYAEMVKKALREAEIPPGTKLAIVGHSYGAYAASVLASDPNFNSLAVKGGTYRVTHVLAAAADVDQFMPRVPGATRLLVLNSEHDAFVHTEEMMYAGYGKGPGRWLGTDGETDTHTEVWFEGGTGTDVGHDPARYAKYLREGEVSDAAEDFFSSFERSYGGEGHESTWVVPG